MPTLYIAGQSQYREEMKGVIESLRKRGYSINSDWPWLNPNATPEDEEGIWHNIRQQIAAADYLLLFPWGPEPLRGALVEVGIALGHGTKVLLVGEHESFGTWQCDLGVTKYYSLSEVLRDIDEGDL